MENSVPFFDEENCSVVRENLKDITENIKYLMTLPKEHEHNSMLTPELLKAYAELADTARTMLTVYDYLDKAKLYTTENYDERLDRVIDLLTKQISKPKELDKYL